MNLPQPFLDQLKQLLSDEERTVFVQALEDDIPVSIRLNPFKKTTAGNSVRVPWCETGYYLPERKKFTFDPLFHAGTYYVQEAGSMLIEQALKQHADLTQPLKVLDLCASPGGKTTHLLSLISEESLLVSNEVIGSRIPALEQNVIKWGTANCIITQNDPEAFEDFSQKFDVIVIDAPCSGEGMFRKHDHAVNEWSPDNVNLCSVRQQRILENVWPALKENGLLLYSTCTFNLQENEQNIRQFLNEHAGDSLRLELTPDWKIKELNYEGVFGYRMMPHLTKSEGFFLSVIRKTETAEREGKIRNQIKPKDLLNWNEFILNPADFSGIEFKQQQYIFPKKYIDFLATCQHELYVRYFGTEIGEVKGTDFIPSQALAQSNHLNAETFRKSELTLADAIRFLQKEAIHSAHSEKGIELVTYQNHPLGFVKNLGNRTNNLFPKNWRILSKQVG
ncbi:MAG: rRNA cytosine-C5-methyltransferase [Bacteroidetes bacterium]|nr:rRNA cytosine-C5-methyltransferase [Bacteroidota bacterium]